MSRRIQKSIQIDQHNIDQKRIQNKQQKLFLKLLIMNIKISININMNLNMINMNMVMDMDMDMNTNNNNNNNLVTIMPDQKLIQIQSLQAIYQFGKYHSITIVVIFLIGFVIMVRYYGTNKNRKIAQKYQAILMPLLTKWFKNSDGQLVYQSPNIYKMYPSQRESCLFAIISFALVPRQQIFSFLLNPIFRLKDELVIEIPVNNQNPLFLTAAIVRRQQIRTITKKSFPDIKQLCKQYKPVVKQEDAQGGQAKLNVPNTHCILVQKSEHVRYFLYSQKQAIAWKNHGKSVKLVYISDVNKFSRYPMAVRMVINLNPDDIVPMLQWLINFVDRMAKAKMSIGQRKEAQKKRQNLNITYD